MLLLLLGCAAAEPPVPEVPVPTDLAALRERSDLVFVGEVVALGPRPGAWSGLLAVDQEVRWRVERVLAGEAAAGAEITVLHPVVARSRTAASTPGLEPRLFAPGSRHLVFVRREGATLRCVSENDGVLPPETAWR